MELTESGKPHALDGSSPYCAELHSGYQAAVQDLQEVRDIAERSGMRLHLTDYHLEATRLALTVEKAILEQTAIEHLQAAKQLIAATGYKRRLPEVTYLEQYIDNKPQGEIKPTI
jgi:hypothetical protein